MHTGDLLVGNPDYFMLPLECIMLILHTKLLIGYYFFIKKNTLNITSFNKVDYLKIFMSFRVLSCQPNGPVVDFVVAHSYLVDYSFFNYTGNIILLLLSHLSYHLCGCFL